MILGIDLGNYAVKTSKEIIFTSKCSTVGNLLNNTHVITDSGTFFIGDGNFDTEYRKTNKEHLKTLLLYAIVQSTTDIGNKIVVGLPLSQYKQDNDLLKETILKFKSSNIQINQSYRKIIIEDVVVYPEGVASTVGTDFEGVVIDIGGRTTDACLVSGKGTSKKVHNPLSIPAGTINMYSEFVKIINARHALDLKIEDADRIIKQGLKINGEPKEIDMAIEVFKQFIEELVNTLQVEYSLKTHDIAMVGGGAQLLFKAIKNRIPGAKIVESPIFANAFGFRKVGEQLWQ